MGTLEMGGDIVSPNDGDRAISTRRGIAGAAVVRNPDSEGR
jgi:hypothetical protein